MENKPPIKQKYIETPELLWEYFEQYIADTKDNPQWMVEQKRGNMIIPKNFEGDLGDITPTVKLPLQRPLTFVGFEVYLFKQGIISDLGDYEKNKDKRYETYAPIITRIKKFIESDCFEGATIGIYNHNIIARKLGLTDNQKVDGTQDVTITVKRGDRHGKGNNTEYTPPGPEQG